MSAKRSRRHAGSIASSVASSKDCGPVKMSLTSGGEDDLEGCSTRNFAEFGLRVRARGTSLVDMTVGNEEVAICCVALPSDQVT